MTATGARAIGSAAWIADEKENVTRLMEQELEEVEFPVRHELDWLNEHMAEIFSKNQFNMTEILKTPGKMRGKTPRTARKRNPDDARVPLTEIFSSSNQKAKPSKFVASLEKSAAFSKPPTKAPEKPTPKSVEEHTEKHILKPAKQPAEASTGVPREDRQETEVEDLPVSKGKEPMRDQTVNKALNSFSTYNIDSGYHGLPDDGEEDDDEVVLAATQILSDIEDPAGTQAEAGPSMQPMKIDRVHKIQSRKSESVDRRTTDQSFHSAQENIRSRGETVEPMDVDEDQDDKADEDTPRPFKVTRDLPASPDKPVTMSQEQPALSDGRDQDGDIALDDNFDDIGSPSDNSTPVRPPMRKKSSLSFASLPAREPLMTKKSNPRISRTSHVNNTVKQTGAGRQSYFGGQAEGFKSSTFGLSMDTEEQFQEDLDGEKKVRSLQSESDTAYESTKLHNKSSTQRLHDKISMLGKTQAPRTTKSIAPVTQPASSQVNYPDLPGNKLSTLNTEPAPTLATTNQEDWIKPLESPYKTTIPKSQTADIMELVAGNDTVGNLEKGKLVRAETLHDLREKRSPTPKGSVFSAFSHHKSASTSTPRRPEQPVLHASNIAEESTTPPVSPKRLDGTLSGPKSKFQSIMKSAKNLFSNSASISAAAKLEILSSPSASRSQPNLSHAFSSPQRSSPGPEKLATRNQRAIENDKLHRSEKERQVLEDPFEEPRVRQEKAQPTSKLDKFEKTQPKERDMRELMGTSHSTQPNSSKTQQTLFQAEREAEVVADVEHQFPLPPTTSHHHSQPTQPAQPTQSTKTRPIKPTRDVVQKHKPQPMVPVSIRVGSTLSRMPMASTSSYIPESNTASTSTASKQPTLSKKASNSSLQTTASNSSFKSSVSNQSQRRAQVAASAEKKKQEEREAALRKEEQKKRTAQQKQQQEETRRQERERSVLEDPKKAAQRQAIEQRRLENSRMRQGSQPPKSANDMSSIVQQDKATGPARPPSRLGSTIQPFTRSITQPPTNPAKPAKRPLEEGSQARPAASAYRSGEQTAETKRRRTEDEYNQQFNHPPPLKQQPIRKENAKPSLMGHGYPQAPLPAAHHQPGGSVYKTAPVQPGAAGRPLKHGAPIDMTQYTSGKIPFAPTNPAGTTTHKTPGHKTPNTGPQRVVSKASPQYPPSETIHLPEPPTDSEDEDSDADILPVAPWADPAKLQEKLREQETLLTDDIFGPVPVFNVEEVFKFDKKLKRFRERTSSANWGGPDGLTEEEINRDLAARHRLRTNGQWSHNVSN
ncbi:hypothetical protein BGW36DRAFT_308750 [Talaromyces proteolyticus]|uniref:Inner centromere protein ARK-binding domain-containing protein n=1 Tax=Talaromyces proteolyticus TaxID=1131652 RepID=A0AAD4KFW0_9EURO|nr:uncharacterized protein BGW36DRAFT_308750 [Talaromyces proteolyticus]KAH8689411.1 hypothetical protein BGW36DRAFT_308750 [Talaromyces proteolyticus]